MGAGAVAAFVAAISVAPAEAEPPYGADVTIELNGALDVPVVLSPGEEHAFPTGAVGACNPSAESGTLTGTFSEAIPTDSGEQATFSHIGYQAAPGDVWVEDDGAICSVLDLDIDGGEITVNYFTIDFTLSGVTATLDITGTGVFEQHIPSGCTLSLEIGEMTGEMTYFGPANAAQLSADDVSIEEASASTCGEGYSHLLNVGFGLPTSDGSIDLTARVLWGEDDEHDHEH